MTRFGGGTGASIGSSTGGGGGTVGAAETGALTVGAGRGALGVTGGFAGTSASAARDSARSKSVARGIFPMGLPAMRPRRRHSVTDLEMTVSDGPCCPASHRSTAI